MAKTGFFQTNTVVEETGTSLSETTSSPVDNAAKPKSSFYQNNLEYESVAASAGVLADIALTLTYCEEWAINPEDDPVSVDAGGDDSTTYSSLHWAAKAAADAVLTAADVVTTNADVVLTNADVVSTNADVVTTNADAASTAADVITTNADAASTAADVLATAADVISTNADAASTAGDAIATAADRVQTGLDAAATAQDAIDTAADSVSTAADAIATAADRVQTGLDAAATAQDAIDTAADLVATNQDTLDTAADLVATNQDTIDTAADAVATAADAIATAADRVQTGLDVVATNADVVLTNADVTYAAQWAIRVEDTPVTVAAGGDNSTTFSALHWAAKAAATAAAIGTLDSLSDVTITTPSNGDALVYSTGTWINSAPTVTFLGLTDTPSSYTGQSLKLARVNAGETAIEFFTGAFTASAISLTPYGNIAATDVQAGLQELDDEKQPLDSDLTSWAGVTRATGFDTFVATPSTANFLSLVTDETFVMDADIGVTVQAYDATYVVDADIGVSVQAYDADLTTWAGITPSANVQSLVGAATYAAMRTLLDLEAGTDFYSITAADGAFQPKDAALTALAAGSDFVQFTGPLTTTKVFTLPDASSTLLYSGGALGTPASGTLTNATGLPAAGVTGTALVAAAIGTTVQAYDADLTTWAGITPSANAQSLVSAASYAAMRTLLDLEAGTDFYSVSGADAAFQPLDADLTTWAGLTPSANAQSLVTAANYAAMRTLLDLEAGTDFYSITAANSAFQPLDSDLTTIAGLTATTDNFIQSKSSAWASRTPTQVTADLIAMVGDSGAGGTKGLVPAPTTGDATKFLSGAGTWVAAAGTGDALTTDPLSQFVATTSAQLAGVISDETGSGALVFGTSPGFTTAANPVSNDGAALGTTALGWSDLFLADGGVINWNSGDVTLTHSSNLLTLSGGDLSLSASNLLNVNSLYMDEQAEADADTAGDGQFWVRDDAPNTPMFTDDAGLDWNLKGGEGIVRRVVIPTPGAFETTGTSQSAPYTEIDYTPLHEDNYLEVTFTASVYGDSVSGPGSLVHAFIFVDGVYNIAGSSVGMESTGGTGAEVSGSLCITGIVAATATVMELAILLSMYEGTIAGMEGGLWTITEYEPIPGIGPLTRPFVYNASESTALAGTSIQFDTTEFEVGDLLVAVIGIDGAFTTPTFPTGWTQGSSQANTEGVMAYKVAAAGDISATLTFGWTNTQDSTGVIFGIHTGSFDAGTIVTGESDGTGTAPIAPDVTATGTNNLVIQGFYADDDDTPYATTAEDTGALDWGDYGGAVAGTAGPGIYAVGYYSPGTGGLDKGAMTFAQNLSEEWSAFTFVVGAPTWAPLD